MSVNTIGIKEFQQRASEFSRRVQAGESFIVYSRSKPVMRLSPVDDGDWEPLLDFTEFKRGGIDLATLRQKLEDLA